MATIADRESDVKFMLGNRTDLDDRIRRWYRDGYLEIGRSYPFEELEDTVEDTMVATIAEYDYPDEARAIKTITMLFDQQQERRLWRRHIRIIERYPTQAPGRPIIYAPFGNQIIVRPVPDQSFDFRWRIWKKPIIDSTIKDTVLNVPDDWLEVLDYAAALRGHVALLERDKAAEVHAILFGGVDPRNGKKSTGLIAEKMRTRSQAENVDSEYAIRPRVRRYTASL